MGVLIASSVLLVFVYQVNPFNITASWSDYGAGTSLVFSYPNATASAGERVAGLTSLQGEVHLATVEEAVRRSGSLYYRVSDPAGATAEGLVTVPARELGNTVAMTVPLLGAWVRTLNHPIGILALVGLPLFMLFLDVLGVVFRRLLPELHKFEMQAYDTHGDTEFSSVLKTQGTREKYGL